jgi:hypothetical protein
MNRRLQRLAAAAVDMVRPFYALYFGGMGAKGGKNFHANVAIRMGYEPEIAEIQDLYLEGNKDEAAARIPSELIQRMSLLGPADKIRHDLEAWQDSFVTTLMISGDQSLPRQAAGSRGSTARLLSAGRRLAGVADAARMRTRPVMSRSSRPGSAACGHV